MGDFTIKDLKEFARRGRVSQAEVDRVIASSERTEKKFRAAEDECINQSRVTLMGSIEFTVPIELLTENALRAMHPIHRGRLLKRQRAVVCNAWGLTFRGRTPALPVEVTMTRYGRHMDPHDSLPAAFKHVTDEVTRLLGLRNDDTKEVAWNYQQQPRGSEPMKIRIRIAPQQSAPEAS